MNKYAAVTDTYKELAAEHDDTFKSICEGMWGDSSSGNSEAPTGYFWLLQCCNANVDGLWRSLLETIQSDMEECGQTFIAPDPGWYIITVNSSGIWFVYEFPSKQAAHKYYHQLESDYLAWEEN